ncbi:MAG: alpha/beta hydrolase [Bdellovibrionales bacterium]|nr:alpha/beta hydrolase [Bdellovibrionales bacterium]
MKKKRLIMVQGWGQLGASLEAVAALYRGDVEVELTSVYELLSDDANQEESSDEQYPETCSPYVRQLARRLASEPGQVVGISMGGLVALELAATFPALVERMVLVSSTACFLSRQVEGAFYQAVHPAALRAMMVSLKIAPTTTLQQFFRRVYSSTRLARERATAAAALDLDRLQHGLRYLEQRDLRSSLGSILQPVLVLHGTNDRVIPAACSEYLAAKLPHGTLRLLPGEEHGVLQESPQHIVKAMERFLW